jgi:hypothetical protein
MPVHAGRGSTAPLGVVDRAAILLVLLALAAGILMFFALPADPGRLTHFVPEQVAMFAIVDSSPQRRALLLYVALLVVGAAGLRFVRPMAWRPRPIWWPHVALAAIFLFQAVALREFFVLFTGRGGADIAMLAAYVLAAIAFTWHRRLSAGLLAVLIASGVLLAWWPLHADSMQHVTPAMMPWVDQHLTALFSGGDMVATGYRLFTDVPANYGFLTPMVIAALARMGMVIDLRDLLRMTEVFQALTLLLFLTAAWARSAGAPPRARLATTLLMLLVTYPFLSMASRAVLLPNQSGYRFVMFPLAALCLVAMPRLSLRNASVLAGSLSGLALLFNVETGVAVTAGLGLAWLLIARNLPWAVAVGCFAAGLIAALAMVAIPVALHIAATGSWPPLDIGVGMSLFRHFAEGFGGLAPPLRITVLFVLGNSGYVLVCALARLLGRAGEGPRPGSAGIAAMIIAWAPYYANRPDDWNFWSFLALEVLLIAPAIAGLSRASLAGIALLLVLPYPPVMALTNDDYFRAMAALPVVERCGAGLSLPPDSCTAQRSRVVELRTVATGGDMLWITGYPYLTWELTRLRPLIPPLDLYAAAITESDLASLAARIKTAHPRLILIDGVAGSVIGDSVPIQMRALHRRIATAAGYSVCASAALQFWEVWQPKGTCAPSAKPAATFQTVGAIGAKYTSMGAAAGPLGPVRSDEANLAGGGRISLFGNGAITWHPAYGTHAVYGLIGAKWLALGREAGCGVPVTDEMPAPGGGRFNDFSGNVTIDFNGRAGTHVVYGLIRARWIATGREGGACGYPISDELDVPGGRRSYFEHGTITWRPGQAAAIDACTAVAPSAGAAKPVAPRS